MKIVTKKTRKKMSNSKLKNPTRYWLGKNRSLIDRKKMSNSKKGKPFLGKSYNWTGKKQSLEHIEKRVSKLRGKPRSEDTKQKLREWNIQHPRYKNKDTKIELKVEEELKKKNIVYKKHFSLYKIANVDFYLPGYDSVIQCDGCYWHNCLTHCPNGKVGSRDKDERQDALLEEQGIRVYRLWEHEINEPDKKYPSSVTVEQLLEFIITK